MKTGIALFIFVFIFVLSISFFPVIPSINETGWTGNEIGWNISHIKGGDEILHHSLSYGFPFFFCVWGILLPIFVYIIMAKRKKSGQLNNRDHKKIKSWNTLPVCISLILISYMFSLAITFYVLFDVVQSIKNGAFNIENCNTLLDFALILKFPALIASYLIILHLFMKFAKPSWKQKICFGNKYSEQ
jgi:hypothetical protein